MIEPFSPTAAIESAWREHLKSSRRGGSSVRDYCYASARRDCVRAMALDLLHPEDMPVWTDDQLERFARGNERESAVVTRLLQIGPRCSPPFKVIEGQRRFEIRDRDGVLLIVGKIDGRLSFEGRTEKPIFEVKSGDSYRRVETIDDLQRSPWTRRAADQLLSYLLAESEPVGLLVIDRPSIPKILEFRLEDHLDRAEGFLRDARAAIDARFGRAPLPPFHQDKSVCRRCDHCGKSCAPPIDFGPGLALVTDESLILAAESRLKHQAAAKEFDAADGELKRALKGVPEAIVGPYLVQGNWQARKKTGKDGITVVDPEGAWITRFTPHGADDEETTS